MVEQVPLGHLIENAYEAFDRGLMSIAGRMILWGSFDNSEKLARRYMQTDGLMIYEKLRLKHPQATKAGFLGGVRHYADEALEYKIWAKEQDGQPIYSEALVTYCAAFENFFKTVAVAFYLANGASIKQVVFIPSHEYTSAYRKIRSLWDGCEDNRRYQEFYELHVVGRNPPDSPYKFAVVSEKEWLECIDIFRLRNAILHNMSRLSKDATIGDEFFYPGLIELQQATLSRVNSVFRKMTSPFDPNGGY